MLAQLAVEVKHLIIFAMLNSIQHLKKDPESSSGLRETAYSNVINLPYGVLEVFPGAELGHFSCRNLNFLLRVLRIDTHAG